MLEGEGDDVLMVAPSRLERSMDSVRLLRKTLPGPRTEARGMAGRGAGEAGGRGENGAPDTGAVPQAISRLVTGMGQLLAGLLRQAKTG